MSVTTTSNPTTTELHRVLNDYAIHLTGVDTEPVNPRSEPDVVNPEDWPEDYHNVPAYRPINRHLNYEERPGGVNPIERLFIATMLNGVWLNAVSRNPIAMLPELVLMHVADGRSNLAKDWRKNK